MIKISSEPIAARIEIWAAGPRDMPLATLCQKIPRLAKKAGLVKGNEKPQIRVAERSPYDVSEYDIVIKARVAERPSRPARAFKALRDGVREALPKWAKIHIEVEYT